MTLTKSCNKCSTPFIPTFEYELSCNSCYQKAREKNCRICALPFSAKSARRKYCDDCRKERMDNYHKTLLTEPPLRIITESDFMTHGEFEDLKRNTFPCIIRMATKEEMIRYGMTHLLCTK